MKKLLCYLGILICFVLVIIPPVLRIFMPDKKEEVKQEVEERTILNCSNSEFSVASSYLGTDIDMIVLKKENVEIKETGSNLVKLFNELKNSNEVSYKNNEDGEIISIDFTLSKHSNLDIDEIIQDIDNVKSWYEQENLVCTIRK